MSDLYYIINFSEGNTTIRAMTREELQVKLDNSEWGESPDFPVFIPTVNIEPGKTISSERVEGLLIIRGKAVIPRAVEVVKKFEV